MASLANTSTVFNFKAKVFKAPDAAFRWDDRRGEACLHVSLGDVTARISLAQIRREFKIATGSPDWHLLSMVDPALKFVSEVRPGDTIPKELLTGEASWTVAPEHPMIARGRLYAAVCMHALGEPTAMPHVGDLVDFTESKLVRKRGDEAFGRLALEAGLEDAGQARQTVETIARDFAYLEALRDCFNRIFNLAVKFDAERRRAGQDRTKREEYERILALARDAGKPPREAFKRAEALLADPAQLVNDSEGAISLIRRLRDALHIDSKRWVDIETAWERGDTRNSDREESLRRTTYQFLAKNFLDSAHWRAAYAGVHPMTESGMPQVKVIAC
ncbi:MAG: hypothetical protein ACFB2Z_10670 [Maricaulaceae bacterium]